MKKSGKLCENCVNFWADPKPLFHWLDSKNLTAPLSVLFGTRKTIVWPSYCLAMFKQTLALNYLCCLGNTKKQDQQKKSPPMEDHRWGIVFVIVPVRPLGTDPQFRENQRAKERHLEDPM